MHRLLAPRNVVASSRCVANASSAAASSISATAAVASSSLLTSSTSSASLALSHVRFMSVGSKRNNRNGLQERRAGGISLPDEDHTLDQHGRQRYKSRKQVDSDEKLVERQQDETASIAEEGGATPPEEKVDWSSDEFYTGSASDREAMRRYKLGEREPLRDGEQSWRQRALAQAGIPYETAAHVRAKEDLAQRQIISPAAKHNPVLQRTIQHINSVDLPPTFDQFSVPALSADELDARQKEVHAKYWEKYSAWKDARPEEHARWLERLKKREMEQDYQWQQSQLNTSNRISHIAAQQTRELLPEKYRESFEQARKSDPSLEEAVNSLGMEEVLRRWNAYQVFLDAEIKSTARSRGVEGRIKAKQRRDLALSEENELEIINNPDLKLTIGQRKKIYKQLLNAQKRVKAGPLWTDPDPRMEGEYDWKMADAFVKVPLLPPGSILKTLATEPDVNTNFSPLHRFLHFERLRQTINFIRDHKKEITRVNKHEHVEIVPHAQSLMAESKEWPSIVKKYPFLADCFLAGVQNMHRSPWPHSDQKDFVTALLRNITRVSKLMDMHFSRKNVNQHWILPYPNNPKLNPDEVLRPMTQKEIRRMEAELLAGRMLETLQQEETKSTH